MKDNLYLAIRKKEDIEIDESLNYPVEAIKDDSKKAYTLLRDMLDILGIEFKIEDVLYTYEGKPYIDGSNVEFNYSHSKNYIACAVSLDNVGCDIEDEFEVSKEGSKLVLDSSTNRLRKAWVKRESYCKLIGKFNEATFKNTDLSKVENDFYAVSTSKYDCSVYYEGNEKKLIVL